METNKHAGKQEPASSSGPRVQEARGQRLAGSVWRAAWSQQQPNVSSEHFICRQREATASGGGRRVQGGRRGTADQAQSPPRRGPSRERAQQGTQS